jgi:sensor histidine kinase regulating citrate/malate metabolism
MRVTALHPLRRSAARAARLSIAKQVLLLQLTVAVLLTAAGVFTAIAQARSSDFDHARAETLALAETVAEAPGTATAVQSADPSAELQGTMLGIQQQTSVDFIVVMSPSGVRYTHPNPDEIGKHYLGDTAQALAGHPFSEVYTGTLGPSVRSVAPIYRADHKLVGLVSVGITLDQLSTLAGRQLPLILAIALGAVALVGLGSWALSRRLRKQTLGLGPQEITRLYEHHDAVLHAMHEGLLVLDRRGRILLANDEALRLLDLGRAAEPNPAPIPTATATHGLTPEPTAGASDERSSAPVTVPRTTSDSAPIQAATSQGRPAPAPTAGAAGTLEFAPSPSAEVELDSVFIPATASEPNSVPMSGAEDGSDSVSTPGAAREPGFLSIPGALGGPISVPPSGAASEPNSAPLPGAASGLNSASLSGAADGNGSPPTSGAMGPLSAAVGPLLIRPSAHAATSTATGDPSAGDPTGRAVAELDLDPALAALLASGRDAHDETHLAGTRVLAVNQSKAVRDGRELGTVVTLRDHTELRALAGELDSARAFADALSASAHEAANRLHTVVTLIELDRPQDAVRFATTELAASQGLIDRLLSAVGDEAVAALLLGKISQAAERGVEVTIGEDTAAPSDLPIPTRDVITILGNLIDNAVDAAAASPAPHRVAVSLRTSAARSSGESGASGSSVEHDNGTSLRRGGESSTGPGDDTSPRRGGESSAEHGTATGLRRSAGGGGSFDRSAGRGGGDDGSGGPGGELTVRVADSGAGIEPDLAEEIFTRGWTTKNEAGHGVGLALVRRAVHGNGGAIEVAADPVLGGAVVTVRLPTAGADTLAEAGR